MNQLLLPLESELMEILSKLVENKNTRAKIIKSLEKWGSLSRLLIKNNREDLKRLIRDLKKPQGPVGKRDFRLQFLTVQLFNILKERLGILGVILFIVIILPLSLVIDIIQIVFAIIILVRFTVI